MNRTFLIAALCLATGARVSRATLIFSPPVSYNEQQSVETSYFANPSLEVGSGIGLISQQVSDTFFRIDLGGAGQISDWTISGTISNLSRESPALQNGFVYAGIGSYAQLNVAVNLFWSAGDDPASLFRAYASGTQVASFTVDDGLPNPFFPTSGPPLGSSFSVALSASSLPGGDPTQGSFYLGFAGSGFAIVPGVGITDSVVGVLSITSAVQAVPEPSALVTLATALPVLAALAWRRRKHRVLPADV